MQLDKVRNIGGHMVVIPQPQSKSDILWLNERDPYFVRERLIEEYRDIWFDFIPRSSKSDIYTKMWQPATIYDDNTGLLISLNEEDSNYIDRIYRQEMHRRINGLYFKNGDKIEWVAGDHYFFLMWAQMQRHDGKGNYADFRKFQGDYFYLIHHCCTNDNILGLFASKPKKTGITNAHWAGFYLNRSTLYANKNLGYMNLDLKIAAKTFSDYFLFAYNRMIPALRPEYRLLSEVNGSITFAETYRQGKKRNLRSGDDSDLNTNVFCVPTKPKAFDVAVMSHITFDEPTKYKESFGEIWRTNKESVKIQSKINGRAWLFNYTPDEDTDSFREARQIFWDSELSTIKSDAKGQTTSQLINWHIPAYAAWEGAFDKYGYCDEERAMREINYERNKVRGDKRALQAITRQYANSKKEAWASAGAGSVFDNIRLSDLLSDVETEQRLSPDPLYIEGKLVWENSLWEGGLKNRRPKGQFCPVKFVPLTDEERENGIEGRLRMYRNIAPSERNACLLNGRDEWGNILPPKRFKYFGGADPTQYAAGGEVIQGSKNAYFTMDMPDDLQDALYKRVTSKMAVSEYYYRPELPNEAYEDFIKEVIYFGKLCVVEANVPFTATSMLEEGLGRFMLVRDKEGNMVQWERWMGLAHEPEKKYHLIRNTSNSSQSKDMLETIIRLIKNYIDSPAAGDKDYGRTIKAERLLKQLMDFNPQDTRLYDLVMAFGYTLLALEWYINYLIAPKDYEHQEMTMRGVVKAITQLI